jgi:hypothetical protein
MKEWNDSAPEREAARAAANAAYLAEHPVKASKPAVKLDDWYDDAELGSWSRVRGSWPT